jgi:DNA repair protein RecO (recombination protein O)
VLIKDKAFILKKTKYGEADLIIQCLDFHGARISFFARSALRSKKRFGGGVLEPTHYVNILYQTKGTGTGGEQRLHLLKEATLIDGFSGLRTDYTRLQTSLHFVQLISNVSREGAIDSKDLFNLLGNSLRAAETSQQLEHLRIQFELKLLSYQGVLPHDPKEESLLREPMSHHAELNRNAHPPSTQ